MTTRSELFDEIHDLGVRVRNAGFTDLGNVLILSNLGDYKNYLEEKGSGFQREDIAAYLRILASMAMDSGFTSTAFNISFIGLLLLIGEDAEKELGMAMTPVAKNQMRGTKVADFTWPDTLE